MAVVCGSSFVIKFVFEVTAPFFSTYGLEVTEEQAHTFFYCLK